MVLFLIIYQKKLAKSSFVGRLLHTFTRNKDIILNNISNPSRYERAPAIPHRFTKCHLFLQL